MNAVTHVDLLLLSLCVLGVQSHSEHTHTSGESAHISF